MAIDLGDLQPAAAAAQDYQQASRRCAVGRHLSLNPFADDPYRFDAPQFSPRQVRDQVAEGVDELYFPYPPRRRALRRGAG